MQGGDKGVRARTYQVQMDGEFHEMKIKAAMVEVLSEVSEDGKRSNAVFDKMFIKALIIGLSSTKSIQDGEKLHEGVKAFVKGYIFHIIYIYISSEFESFINLNLQSFFHIRLVPFPDF